MTTVRRVSSAALLAALGDRLAVVARTLGVPPGVDAGDTLVALNRRVAHTQAADEAWLALVGVSGVLPTEPQVAEHLRLLELLSPDEAAIAVLARGLLADWAAHGSRRLEVVTGAVVADVDNCARVDRHTGIQRVVRESMPRWLRAHPVLPLAWTADRTALRRLTPLETDRVLHWNDQRHVGRSEPPPDDDAVVVPWRCRVLVPEVPAPELCPRVAALAELSGSTMAAIGYDAIPILSADVRPPHEPDNYVSYLSVVQHCDRVAAISISAALEFRGFAEMLSGQGLPGPTVTEVVLPGQATHADAQESADHSAPDLVPAVLCVGSQETHKNHLAVLQAADVLWRRGRVFSLAFVGGPGWQPGPFDERVAELRREGRPVEVLRGVSDARMWTLYASARFTVFPSLHEGYGLPVAESLACGTPVVTSGYGSMREIAEAGGCLLVDPRDDDDIAAAMDRLLTDDDLLDRLRTDVAGRPRRDWDTYAAEAWTALVPREDAE